MTMVTHNENQTVTVPRLLLHQLCRLLLRLLAACSPASLPPAPPPTLPPVPLPPSLRFLELACSKGGSKTVSHNNNQRNAAEQESRTDLRASVRGALGFVRRTSNERSGAQGK